MKITYSRISRILLITVGGGTLLLAALPAQAASDDGNHKKHHATIAGKAFDSLEVGLRKLDEALRHLDTVLKGLDGHHFNMHMDSMSFGPYHFKQMKIPAVEVPEMNFDMPEIKIPNIHIPKIEIPEIEIPDINIPKIEIPEMNEDIYIGDSDHSSILNPDTNGMAILNGTFGAGNPDFNGYAYLDGDKFPLSGQYFSNLAYAESSPGSSPTITSDYYSDGTTKYFIKNPKVKEPRPVAKVKTIPIGEK